MSKIGTIPANSTTTLNVQNLPEFILLLDDSGFVVSRALEVVISGDNNYNISSQALQEAINKIGNAGVLADFTVFPLAQIANGGVGNKQVDITITNNSASVLEVFGFSTSNNDGTIVRASQSTIVANSNDTYSNFESLVFTNSNVLNVEVEFASGWKDRYTKIELDALLSKLVPSIENLGFPFGSLVTAIDNRLGFIKSVRIFANEDGNVTVVKKSYVSLP